MSVVERWASNSSSLASAAFNCSAAFPASCCAAFHRSSLNLLCRSAIAICCFNPAVSVESLSIVPLSLRHVLPAGHARPTTGASRQAPTGHARDRRRWCERGRTAHVNQMGVGAGAAAEAPDWSAPAPAPSAIGPMIAKALDFSRPGAHPPPAGTRGP